MARPLVRSAAATLSVGRRMPSLKTATNTGVSVAVRIVPLDQTCDVMSAARAEAPAVIRSMRGEMSLDARGALPS